MRTLLVEGIKDLDSILIASLGADGDIVDRVADPSVMLKSCHTNQYDFIVINLEGLRANGSTLVKSLRQHRVESPVFVVAERAEIEDKIGFLDIGADDYIVQPVNLREIKARLRSVIRRQRGFSGGERRIGNLIMDTSARAVMVDNKNIDLNPREFQLFELLIARLDQIVPKERLMDQLFGADDEAGPNALELYVSRVRQKIRASNIRIETVRCVGYVARRYK